jgi:adenosylcobinamide amidohydrolase
MSTVGSDGIARSKIVGKGTVLVDYKPKDQEYKISEVLTCTSASGMESEGSGMTT